MKLPKTRADARRGYQHAIDEFVAWYCSEPRLAFNKTVVCGIGFMAAVRRLAYEAADSGRLSPELAAGCWTNSTASPAFLT